MIDKSPKTMNSSPVNGISDTQPEPLSAWHKPVIMRIELKRTMQDNGSFSDGPAFTPTDSCRAPIC